MLLLLETTWHHLLVVLGTFFHHLDLLLYLGSGLGLVFVGLYPWLPPGHSLGIAKWQIGHENFFAREYPYSEIKITVAASRVGVMAPIRMLPTLGLLLGSGLGF